MSAEAIAPARKVRPFYWSIRRELWENRAILIAPLAVEGVVLLAYLFFGSFHLPKAMQAGAKAAHQAVVMPYAAAAGAAFMITFLVAVFYSLGALHGERRDRSLLFWKSLPVSDLTTVLSKAAIPLVVQNVYVFLVAVATQAIMLVWSTLMLLLHGIDPGLMWAQLHLPFIWVMLAYGLVLNALWDVPFYGWLLLVSAWAKRMTFVWAVAPWLLLALFEYLAFRTRNVWDLIDARVFGGMSQIYTVGGKGKVAISSFDQLDPGRFFSNPGLWIGLVFGVACLAACVWLRRRHEPI